MPAARNPRVSAPTWNEAWSLRIDAVDAEHRALIDQLAQLAERFAAPLDQDTGAPRAEQGAAELQHEALMLALERFGEHARVHFQNEEAFMRAIDYPGLGGHRSEHALLLAEYVEMVRDLKEQNVTLLDPETVSALRGWVVAHILGSDREFADHYYELLRGGRRVEG
jgi:hemerythrin